MENINSNSFTVFVLCQLYSFKCCYTISQTVCIWKIQPNLS